MFEYIKGTLKQLTPMVAVIETADGVGWFVNISIQTSGTLQKNGIDSNVKLLLHQYVAQDQAPVLYGFASEEERNLFRLLISVSGIGANTARIMLSTYTAQQLGKYIVAGNTRAIQKTKGIGQKIAERAILELKNKITSSILGGGEGSLEDGNGNMSSSSEIEAVQALVVLGFPQTTAEKTVHKVYVKEPDLSVEDLIRKALSEI